MSLQDALDYLNKTGSGSSSGGTPSPTPTPAKNPQGGLNDALEYLNSIKNEPKSTSTTATSTAPTATKPTEQSAFKDFMDTASAGLVVGSTQLGTAVTGTLSNITSTAGKYAGKALWGGLGAYYEAFGKATGNKAQQDVGKTFKDLGNKWVEDFGSTFDDAHAYTMKANNWVNEGARSASDIIKKDVKIGGQTKEEYHNRVYTEVENTFKPRIDATNNESNRLTAEAQVLENLKKTNAFTSQAEVDAYNARIDKFNKDLEGFNEASKQLGTEYEKAMKEAKPDAATIKDYTDPRFLMFDLFPSILENAPTMAAQFYVGRKLSAGRALLGKVIGLTEATGFSLALNATIEADNQYSQALKDGYGEKEALTRAKRVFERNGIANSLFEGTQMLTVFGPNLDPKSLLVKTLLRGGQMIMSGVLEAGQERGEDAIQQMAAEEKFNRDAFLKKIADPNLSKTDLIAFALGMGFGAGSAVVQEAVGTMAEKELEWQSKEVLRRLEKEGVEPPPGGGSATERVTELAKTAKDKVKSVFLDVIRDRMAMNQKARTDVVNQSPSVPLPGGGWAEEGDVTTEAPDIQGAVDQITKEIRGVKDETALTREAISEMEQGQEDTMSILEGKKPKKDLKAPTDKEVKARDEEPVTVEERGTPEFEISDFVQEEANQDWEDNYAENYGELNTKYVALQKQLKTAKKSEVSGIKQKMAQINNETTAIEEGFVQKWRKQAVDKALQDTIDTVTNKKDNKQYDGETNRPDRNPRDDVGEGSDTSDRGDDTNKQAERGGTSKGDSEQVARGGRDKRDTSVGERPRKDVKQGDLYGDWQITAEPFYAADADAEFVGVRNRITGKSQLVKLSELDEFTGGENVNKVTQEETKDYGTKIKDSELPIPNDQDFEDYLTPQEYREYRHYGRDIGNVSEERYGELHDLVMERRAKKERPDEKVIEINKKLEGAILEEMSDGSEWLVSEVTPGSVWLYPADKPQTSKPRVVEHWKLKEDFRRKEKQLQKAPTEKEVVETLKSGGSVKATDLARAMGIEVVEVRAEVPDILKNLTPKQQKFIQQFEKEGIASARANPLSDGIHVDVETREGNRVEFGTKYKTMEEATAVEKQLEKLYGTTFSDNDTPMLDRYYAFFKDMFDLYEDKGMVAQNQADAMDKIIAKGDITEREAEYILNTISYMGGGFVENKEKFTEYFNGSAKKVEDMRRVYADRNVPLERYTTQQALDILTEVNDQGEVILKEGVEVNDRLMDAVYAFEPAGGRETEGVEGRGLLDEYYTPEEAVDILDKLADYYGGSGGYNVRALEPAAGTGNLLSVSPSLYPDFEAFEINETAARVGKVLNQGTSYFVKPFEERFIDKRGNKKEVKQEYGAVVMNPPYGEHRGLYKGLGEEPTIKKYEEYFLKRGMDVMLPDGVLYAVIPSNWLRNTDTYTKREIAKQGELLEAFRLPNSSFEKTDIGTDVVVIRKDSEGQKPTAQEIDDRVRLMSDDKFFKDNPTHVLGTTGERKGRFGIEEYVEGTLNDALNAFNEITLKVKPSFSETQKEKATKKEAKPAKKTPQDIKKEVKEKAEPVTKPAVKKRGKAPAKKKGSRASDETYVFPKEVYYESDKTDTSRLKMSKYSKATKEDLEMWKYVIATGELEGDFDKSKANYHNGKYYNDFNYYQGNVYEKLDQLELDKAEMSEEQYERQKKGLEAIMPQEHPLDRINITPNAKFVHETIMSNGQSLATNFKKWIQDIPYNAFKRTSRWDISHYVDGVAVRGSDKIRNEETRKARREEGNRFFVLYLNENLNEQDKKILVEQYNKKFNGYVRPDYTRVPLMSELHSTFKGKELNVKPVQIEGVSFLVNKGVGLLAHDVGVGKTMEAIIANAELLQRGWAKRPLIVVPNTQLYDNWLKEIRALIPDVKINLLGNLGGDFYGDVKDLKIEDGTLSLITSEGFSRLGFKEETYTSLTGDVTDALDKTKAGLGTKRQQAKDATKAEEMVGKAVRGTKDDVFFEDLGFDNITYDEIQNANHVFGSAKIGDGKATEFRGMTQQPSVEGTKLWLAAQHILKNNNGRGVIGLSATPFRNHVLEYYSILSMFARERMQQLGVFSVNDFMTMFMELSVRQEFKANQKYEEKTDVRSFTNYQQFQKLLTEFIDFKEDNTGRPERHTYEHKIPENSRQLEFRQAVQPLFADVKHGGVLKAIGDMRQSAISPYLSLFNQEFTPTQDQLIKGSPKLRMVAEMVARNLKDNPEGNQVIYSPIGVEVFGYLKDEIVKQTGLKPDQVQILSGKPANPKLTIPLNWPTSKGHRVNVIEKFNDTEGKYGDDRIKVVIGSEVIEEGVNLQRRSTDLFILSQPWNFTALRQVMGRIWRPGNQWKNVRIHHMLTENSSDIFMAQKLQTKMARYESSLAFKGDTLDVSDIDYEELKFDLLTDPVARVDAEFLEKDKKLGIEIMKLESDIAYKTRKVEKYVEARQRLFRQEKEQIEHPDWNWLANDIARSKQRLEEIRVEYTERNIDLTSIDTEIDEAQAKLKAMEEERKNLGENKQVAIAEAKVARDAMAETATENADFTAELNTLGDETMRLFGDKERFFQLAPGDNKWTLRSRLNGRYYGSVSLDDILVIPADKIQDFTEDMANAVRDVKNGKVSPSSLPILVKDMGNGFYEIIDGRHRYALSSVIGRDEVVYAMTDEAQYEKLANAEEKVNAGTSAGFGAMFQSKDARLIDEARNYSSFEDFLKTFGDPYFHGTRNDFKKFHPRTRGKNTGWANTKLGYFFIKSKDEAQKFIEDYSATWYGTKGTPRVVEAYLDLKNPVDLTTRGVYTNKKQAPALIEATEGSTMTEQEALNYINEAIGLGEFSDFYDAVYENEETRAIFEKHGFDGIIAEFGNDQNEYVVFRPSQITTRTEIEDAWRASRQPGFQQNGYTFRGVGIETAVRQLQDYKDRLRLDFPVDFVDVILTPDGGKALGVEYEGGMTLTKWLLETSVDHEVVHKVIRHIEKIDLFKDIRRSDLLRAANGGRDYTVNDVERLSEKLAYGYEQFIANRPQKQVGIVQRFFEKLKSALTTTYNAIGNENLALINDFYTRLAEGKSEGEVVVELRAPIPAEQRVTRTGDIMVDFGFAEKRAAIDGIRQEFFQRLIEQETDEVNISRMRKDINILEKFTAQSRDLYLKDSEEFAAADAYGKVADLRRDNKRAIDNKFVEMLKPYYALKQAGMEKVNKVLMQGDRDGKEYKEATLRGLNLNAEEIEAYKGVRKAFNAAHAVLLDKMRQHGVPDEEIKAYEAERIGYMPHKWQGRYVVKTQRFDADENKWKTERIDDYKTERAQKRAYEEMKQATKDPEVRLVLDTLDNLEVDFFTQQGLSFEAMKDVIIQSSAQKKTKAQMIDAIRNMFKEKGFGRQYIRRTGVEGYDTEGIPRIMADYFSGFAGYVTKMEAAKQYYAILSEVDARRQKNFYNWLRDAIAYDMGQSVEWEKLKATAFAYYLANDISFLAVNATQNFIVGAGELSKYLEGADKVTKPEAYIIKAMLDWTVKNVTDEERIAIEKLLEVGELGGQMASELTGFKNNPLYSTISSVFNKALFSTTQIVETNVNRVPAFLAARRIFKEQGMTDKEANEKALEVSDDIHFRYGKQHRPEFLRGRKNVLFVFYHYMRSFMYQLYRDASQKEYASFARKMMWTTAIGGVTSLPFAKLFMIIFSQIAGGYDDDDLKEEMKGWELLYKKGIPAYVGVDLSNRVGIELMTLNQIAESQNDIRSYLGVIGSLLWVNFKNPDEGGRLQRAITLLGQGREQDALGYLLPDMFANPFKAWQGYTVGVRSFAGTPLETADGRPFKYNTWEAIIKATGLTPTRESLRWDAKSKEWDMQDRKQAARSDIRREIQYLVQTGDYEEARTVQNKALAEGVIDEDTDYVREFGKARFIEEGLAEWNAVATPNTADLKRIEEDIIKQAYPEGATDLQRNNVRKEFAVYRTFGMENNLVNDLMSAESNEEKVQLLLKARFDMGEEAFKEFFNRARKQITLESGRKSEILISDDLKELYRKAQNP